MAIRSPLFDIFDPYQTLQAGMLPEPDEEIDPIGLMPIRRKPTISDLMPEEEKRGMLRSLADYGASGLSGLGYLLDTPGALARGILAGKPLSVLGSSEERVSGRDLARQYGLAGDEDNWLNFAGGLGVEMITDPLTYLNPFSILGRGAYGTAGRTAQRAGLLENASLLANKQGKGIREFGASTTARQLIADSDLPDAAQRFSQAARGKGLDMDALLDQPLAGLAEARIPGFESGTLLGVDAAKVVGRTLDRFGDDLKRNPYTAPVVNRMTRAFDPTVLERLDPDDQWRARQAVADAKANERNLRESAAWQWQQATAAQPDGALPFANPRVQNALRDTIEAQLDPGRMANLVDQEAVRLIDSVPAWSDYRSWLRDQLADAQTRRSSLGLQTPNAASVYDTGYFPSQAVRFATDQSAPLPPGKLGRAESAYDRGQRVYSVSDLVGRSRNPYLDLDRRSETLRRLMAGDAGAALRDRLYGASDDQIPSIIDEAFNTLRRDDVYNLRRSPVELPYERVADREGNTIESIRAYLSDPTLVAADRKAGQGKLDRLLQNSSRMKVQLGDLLRTADRQFASNNLGLFDNSTLNDLMRYGVGGGRSEANANVILDTFTRAASDIPADQMTGGGAVNLLKAAEGLGFDKTRLREVLESRLSGRSIDELSIPETVIKDLQAISPLPKADPSSLLGNVYRSFTNAFKIGALANPAYHTRNLYSGYLASLMRGGASPLELAFSMRAGVDVGAGNYERLYQRLRNAPRYQHITDPEELIQTALADMARGKLGGGLIEEGAAETRNIVPGMETQEPVLFGKGAVYDPKRTWRNWLSSLGAVRGVDFAGAASGRQAPSETLNPLLRLHERAGKRVEDANRIGNWIEMVRQGANPDAAAENVLRTQVDYSPQAYTNFERKLKTVIPFYSYPRGIAPLVAENLLYRPGGLQGQTMRAINRGSEQTEDSFLPEYLRQSASIQIPGAPTENLQRVLTNIDLPYESLVNLVSPGVGNTFPQRAYDTARRTGMNLLGQLNPVIKAPLEMILNRQLYTGRELSDLYSVLEQDLGPIGRPIEQLAVNFVPGGSKLNSIYRTLRDNRLSPTERALKLLINNTLGAKVTDYDREQSKQKAARATLNDLLSTTPGVRTYENLTVPEDVLRAMPREQQQQILLYRIIQSEAAKRAREKKKANLDPLQMLGVVNQF